MEHLVPPSDTIWGPCDEMRKKVHEKGKHMTDPYTIHHEKVAWTCALIFFWTEWIFVSDLMSKGSLFQAFKNRLFEVFPIWPDWMGFGNFFSFFERVRGPTWLLLKSKSAKVFHALSKSFLSVIISTDGMLRCLRIPVISTYPYFGTPHTARRPELQATWSSFNSNFVAVGRTVTALKKTWLWINPL